MTDDDAFRIMSRETAGRWLCVVIIFAILIFTAPARAELRLEGAVGIAKHTEAPEGSWWYQNYATDTKLLTSSYQLGAMWTPIRSGAWSYGARAGYANLGTVQSWNSFPIFEDGTHRDNRVNPHCNQSTLEGCIGAYNGQGKASGYYLGPMLERDFGGGVALGAELGAYRYKSAWTADQVRGVDPDGVPFCSFGGDWDYARGYHTTSYLGAHARWEWMQFSVRRYSNVRASRVDVNKDFVGMTSGGVWTLQIGVSIPLTK